MLCANAIAQQDEWYASRPDGHAPIEIMGDHYHEKGELMCSYRYMLMKMDGVRRDSHKINKEEVLKKYQMSPNAMTMDMHMFGVMYALSDRVTLMAMGSYKILLMKSIWMQHNTTKNPVSHKFDSKGNNITKSKNKGAPINSGFSDTKVGTLIKIFNKTSQSLHLNTMLIIPTGSIEEKGTTMSVDLRSAYPMQLGAGSWGTMLGFTYLVQGEALSGGVQPIITNYFGDNPEGYKIGNKINLSSWMAFKASDWVSVSAVLQYQLQSKTEGSDPIIKEQNNKMFEKAGKRHMMPGFESTFLGGSILNTGLGVNLYVPKGILKGIRLGVQYSLPIHQDVNGIQMSIQNNFTLGLQYSLKVNHRLGKPKP
ncbi:alpha amylase, catalytic subdomain protein [Elysia marginata]|uniref:Alpha amylase, catalytic subdomain protein n=1 Tax=Elysia marginata TaxID=1093978 RepID=A0AAV4JX66_9GAST|nr:alpha amylase, catalytic subdomain protein [Elysia marginata]